jgi:hypothetical protein
MSARSETAESKVTDTLPTSTGELGMELSREALTPP